MKIFTEIISKEHVNYPTDVLTVSLTLDERKRGRLKVITGSGESIGIQIERGQTLRDGTWLTAKDNSYLCVLAKNESVSSAYIEDVTLFARACYHLGNRHVPLQIGDKFLRYQSDYVLDDMLSGLGVNVIRENAPFEPESGAYAEISAHVTGHHHDHTHANDDDEHEHEHTHQH